MLFKRQLSGAKKSIAFQNSFRTVATPPNSNSSGASGSARNGNRSTCGLPHGPPKCSPAVRSSAAQPARGVTETHRHPDGGRHVEPAERDPARPTRCAFAASFDGYLSASPNVTQFIRELSAGAAGVPKPVADFRSSHLRPRGIAQASSHASLAYLGVHWDGARHGALLDGLARDGLISLYGRIRMASCRSAYQGQIPFGRRQRGSSGSPSTASCSACTGSHIWPRTRRRCGCSRRHRPDA